MEEKFEFKDKEVYPIELIMCRYCSARLNRVGNKVIPTSCIVCGKHGMITKPILVKEVIKIQS